MLRHAKCSEIRARLLRAGLLLAAGYAVGCGSSSESSPSPSPSPGPIVQEDFPAALAAAYCPTVEACCPGTNASCASEMQAWAESVFTDPSFAKQAYDPEAARKCVDAIESAGTIECSRGAATELAAVAAACAAVIDGTLPPGAECEDVVECKHGSLYGTRSSGFVGCGEFDGALPKRCREFKPTTTAGAACEEAFGGQGATVSVCAGDLYCEQGQCAPAGGEGASCGPPPCAEDLLCASSVCVVQSGKEGDACTNGCAPGFECMGTTCATVPPAPWVLTLGWSGSNYTCD